MDSDRIEPQDAPRHDREAREDFLRQLLRRSNWKVTAELVSVARTQLGIRGQPYFGDGVTFSENAPYFKSCTTTAWNAGWRISPRARVERVIADQIERFWLKKENRNSAG